MKIIVGVTGATGVEMSYYLLKALKQSKDCEIHLIVSQGAKVTWSLESRRSIEQLQALADQIYDEDHLAAIISSGSFMTDGMIVMPCSMKTLAGIATGYADNLIGRCADVCLKEGRKVVLVGSFMTDGMIVMPCSMKTLAGIATGYADNLIGRCADVCLKEGRKVVLVPREMPFNRIHLKNLKEAGEAGCVIIPPMLTFYNGAETMMDQVDHIIGKILMQFGLTYDRFVPWTGEKG